ncbi:hypothetical protein [Pseudonocardia phyllosphaerae]|uniref:hypothetical protein n=1 Tax=Pseudonocardia phyllosphaerae TaxID=3390502 RepID=UPI00397CD2AF
MVVLLPAAFVSTIALSGPAGSSPLETTAEWARDHGLNWLVTDLEKAQYAADAPAEGGTPDGGIPHAAGVVAGSSGAAAPLTPVATGRPLPGEGVWQTVVASHGRPAVQVTTLRVDPTHTRYLAGVMRLDPRLVRGTLHPGVGEPRGHWRASTSLAGAAGADVAAAFNGGFKLSDPSHNGYYAEGRTVAPLADGKASLVLHADGTADVGAWGSEVRMGPDVASVRQNLLPLVDRGAVNPQCAGGGEAEWGSTVGQAAFVHRSGFGVTADGTEIYVGGPALSVCTLGTILADAGVVRGMELDINPAWVSGAYFHDRPGREPRGYALFPGEQVAPTHYLQPTGRDWYAWDLRRS